MSDQKIHQIHPIKYPVRRIEDRLGILSTIKNCDRVTSTLSLSAEPNLGSDKTTSPKMIARLYKKAKYSRHIKVNRESLSNATQIHGILMQLKRLKSTRGLRIICTNSNADNAIYDITALKPLRYFSRLENVALHIYMNLNIPRILEKFASLVQAFRARNLNIKEPLAFANDRGLRRFYSRLRDSGRRFECLKISNYTPLTGLIEQFSPFKFISDLSKWNTLREVHINFVGISIRTSSLKGIVQLLKNFRSLSSLNLNLSFNQISNLNCLDELAVLSLRKLSLNLSNCPLDETSYSHLARLITKSPELISLNLILSSVKACERVVLIITNAIKSLKNLESLTLSLNENRCIEAATLHTFFSNIFSSNKLTKVVLNLSRAFIGGVLGEQFHIMPPKKTSLKTLKLDISNNRLRDSELLLMMRLIKNYSELEDLEFILENSRISNRTAEMLWKWIASYKKLRCLELSLLFCDMDESNLTGLLKDLSQMNISHLGLDVLDVVTSKVFARTILEELLTVNNLESCRFNTGYFYESLPSDFKDTVQSRLPKCARYQIL